MSNYTDSDGNPCTLDALCRREPAWAANRIRAEIAKCEALSAQVDGGHALYGAIVETLRPHFPANSRDLEWDVLPATLGALARRAESAERSAANATARAKEERMSAWLAAWDALRVEFLHLRDDATAHGEHVVAGGWDAAAELAGSHMLLEQAMAANAAKEK